MFPEQIVRAACQAAYCMDYRTYVDVMQLPYVDPAKEKLLRLLYGDPAKEKFLQMQNDFSKWYSSLDSLSSSRFMNYALRREEA